MAPAVLPDDVFIAEFQALGGERLARKYNISPRGVMMRRRDLESKYGIIMTSPVGPGGRDLPNPQAARPWRIKWSIPNGTILIGSDFHLWPGDRSVCQRAFLKICDDVRPAAVVVNGDVMDFPLISRHPMGWESAPTPQQEIEVAQDYLNDLQKVARRAKKAWPRGNHDYRLEAYAAQNAPMLKNIKGIHLHDHFEGIWERCMSIEVNFEHRGGETIIKHRWKGGKHAPGNNTVNAGCHMVTGHMHSQKCYPHTDYMGTRYGVDTGMVCNPAHRAFLYTEDAPTDWREGFALITYRDGRMMQPELITAWSDTEVQFRGQLIKV